MEDSSFFPPEILLGLRKLAADNTHGSAFLARKSLDLLAKGSKSYAGPASAAEFRQYLVALAWRLCMAQPSMYAVSNQLAGVLDRFFDSFTKSASWTQLTGKLEKIIENQQRRSLQELDSLGEKGAVLLVEKFPGRAKLITLSYSESVLAVLRRLSDRGLEISVAESRPLREGVSLAEKLAGLGFEVTLVTDAMLGLETLGASCALVGADSVTREGTLINKAGTRLLALSAKMDQVPVYCCCQSCKIQPAALSGPESPRLEQKSRPPHEVLRRKIEGLEVRNLYFDQTEYFLISGFITELGFLRQREIQSLSEEFSAIQRRVFGGAH